MIYINKNIRKGKLGSVLEYILDDPSRAYSRLFSLFKLSL